MFCVPRRHPHASQRRTTRSVTRHPAGVTRRPSPARATHELTGSSIFCISRRLLASSARLIKVDSSSSSERVTAPAPGGGGFGRIMCVRVCWAGGGLRRVGRGPGAGRRAGVT